jgi:hypothetical protein
MKRYYVLLSKPRVMPHGWSNFLVTRYLGRARYFAKRLKRNIRQIDVRDGRRAYVLKGSWL